ncbi:hypothetical protein D9M69_374580 [compost metagenome]
MDKAETRGFRRPRENLRVHVNEASMDRSTSRTAVRRRSSSMGAPYVLQREGTAYTRDLGRPCRTFTGVNQLDDVVDVALPTVGISCRDSAGYF